MMNKKGPPDAPRLAYVLRVSITDSRPPIWRKLSVPENYTLGNLHTILQIAFGWDNGHPHSFTVNSTEYGMTDLDDMGFGDDYDIIDEETVRLSELDLQPKQKFSYLYDFGDSWEHGITVSKIIPIDTENGDAIGPHCLGGKRAGPLEDSGGIWGYEEMLEVLKDPNHKEYEGFHEWVGDFDPEYLSLDEINTRLEQVFKPKSRKAKKSPSA